MSYILPGILTPGLFAVAGNPSICSFSMPIVGMGGGGGGDRYVGASENAASKIKLMQEGARQIVDNCLKVEKGERAVLITDNETKAIADIVFERLGKSGARTSMFVMEDFGPRPDDESNPLKLHDSIAEALAAASVSIYLAQIRPGELHSFRFPLIELVEKYGLRHAHMPKFTEQMMWQGMASDYSKIQRLSKNIYDIVSKADIIKVTTEAGTDVTFEFDRSHRWCICDGNVRPGDAPNLPGGEVFTAPLTANGIVVVDGGFGDFFSTRYGDIGATPLSYSLIGGRCIRESIRCANAKLKADFEKYTFETDENSDRVGEFAIGTNIGLTEIIGNMLQDEKLPGVHIALGDPLGGSTGATWKSKAHNDGLLRNPTVTAGGEAIMKSGEFMIDY